MSHDDFDFEPVPGLPEHLPEGERILWQGRPDTRALAREALNIRWVVGYFAVLTIWRFGSMLADAPIGTAFAGAVPFVILGAVVCMLLYAVAWVQARATVYTITTARVAMRIGAALTLTLNLPFTQIRNAGLDRRGRTGTIALELDGDTRLSFLVLWPHARPWHLRQPQPALRCVPDAERVARILADAAETRVATPRIETKPQPAAVAAE